MSNGVDNNPGFAITLAHEFGHIQYAWRHSIGLSSNDTAVAFENEVRLLIDPSGPTRKIHQPGDPNHGSGEFRIRCPGCAIR
jgi:hypothetical protein